MTDSSIPGFFEKSRKERLDIIQYNTNLTPTDINTLLDEMGGVSFEKADKMVENAIGTFSLPLGVATNFKINGRDYIIPMAIEEPSVIAAASKGAKAARIRGGFSAQADTSYMTGQIQLLNTDMKTAPKIIQKHSDEILNLANSKSHTLPAMGKGAKSISSRILDTPSGDMVIVEIQIDVGDAMGANITNTMCETISPLLENITGGRALLKILSNYSTDRMVRATATFDKDVVGSRVIDDMLLAFEFADYDVHRAVTHNKGIMNGIIAVANATGQDSRAIEAAANAYAAKSGTYRSLTRWSKDADGNLSGMLELPMSVGIVGGIAGVHPISATCIKMLGADSAQELACIMASAGLAQNYSALHALSTEGIQKGHMKLHARNVAAAAGAALHQIDHIVDVMVREGNISVGRARQLLGQI